MNEDLLKNIFYRPEVSIERDYSTDGTIDHYSPEPVQETVKPTPIQNLLTKAEEVTDALIRIRNVLPALPNQMPEVLENIVDNLIFQTEIEKNELIDIPDEPITETVDNNDISEDGVTPDEEPYIDDEGHIWGAPQPLDYVITVVKHKNNSQLAQEQYLKDSIYIKEEFATRLNNVLQDYLYPLVTTMDESGVGNIEYLNIEYDGTSVTGYGSDDKHLHDLIVRGQIINGERERLFVKSHDAITTQSIIMAFDVCAQERVRYYTENYDLGVSNFTEMYRRNTLEKTRNEYEYKYAHARKNFWKYLNSAVKISEDMLKTALDVNTAKCYLLSQDIDIFAKKEYQAAAYESATGTGAQEVDPTNNTANKATDTIAKKQESDTTN